jgi:hypothetical protein
MTSGKLAAHKCHFQNDLSDSCGRLASRRSSPGRSSSCWVFQNSCGVSSHKLTWRRMAQSGFYCPCSLCHWPTCQWSLRTRFILMDPRSTLLCQTASGWSHLDFQCCLGPNRSTMDGGGRYPCFRHLASI